MKSMTMIYLCENGHVVNAIAVDNGEHQQVNDQQPPCEQQPPKNQQPPCEQQRPCNQQAAACEQQRPCDQQRPCEQQQPCDQQPPCNQQQVSVLPNHPNLLKRKMENLVGSTTKVTMDLLIINLAEVHDFLNVLLSSASSIAGRKLLVRLWDSTLFDFQDRLSNILENEISFVGFSFTEHLMVISDDLFKVHTVVRSEFSPPPSSVGAAPALPVAGVPPHSLNISNISSLTNKFFLKHMVILNEDLLCSIEELIGNLIERITANLSFLESSHKFMTKLTILKRLKVSCQDN